MNDELCAAASELSSVAVVTSVSRDAHKHAVRNRCKRGQQCTHCVAWSIRPSALFSMIARIHAAFSSRCCAVQTWCSVSCTGQVSLSMSWARRTKQPVTPHVSNMRQPAVSSRSSAAAAAWVSAGQLLAAQLAAARRSASAADAPTAWLGAVWAGAEPAAAPARPAAAAAAARAWLQGGWPLAGTCRAAVCSTACAATEQST
jgi:hypothetical protein